MSKRPATRKEAERVKALYMTACTWTPEDVRWLNDVTAEAEFVWDVSVESDIDTTRSPKGEDK